MGDEVQFRGKKCNTQAEHEKSILKISFCGCRKF